VTFEKNLNSYKDYDLEIIRLIQYLSIRAVMRQCSKMIYTGLSRVVMLLQNRKRYYSDESIESIRSQMQ